MSRPNTTSPLTSTLISTPSLLTLVPPASAMSTMLETLQPEVPHQMDLIRSSPGYLFQDCGEEVWKQLYQKCWGMNADSMDHEHNIERGPGSDIINSSGNLDQDVPTHSRIMDIPKQAESCWDSYCDGVFIRTEYNEAEQYAVSTCRDSPWPLALLIAGQPGIGIHFFCSTTTSFEVFWQGNHSSFSAFSCAVLP